MKEMMDRLDLVLVGLTMFEDILGRKASTGGAGAGAVTAPGVVGLARPHLTGINEEERG